MAQKITPNLWFNGNAKEAAEFYVNAFPDSALGAIEYYPKTVEDGLADFQLELAGKELTVEFTVGGQLFVGINAGPEFSFNPSISFMVNFDPSRDDQARESLDDLWEKLVDGGEALMPLGEYPFSKRYGWVKDRYGLSWQLSLTDPSGDPRPFIIPSLLFSDKNTNRAEEAITFYTTIFDDAKLGTMARYEEKSNQATAGSLMFADFTLAGQWFAAMDDGSGGPGFAFSPAISLSVACKDQAEIDYFWEKLSVVPEAEQCGWCMDKYGVSWQIVPANIAELMQRPNAFANMMQMKKLVIDEF